MLWAPAQLIPGESCCDGADTRPRKSWPGQSGNCPKTCLHGRRRNFAVRFHEHAAPAEVPPQIKVTEVARIPQPAAGTAVRVPGLGPPPRGSVLASTAESPAPVVASLKQIAVQVKQAPNVRSQFPR